MLVWIIVVVLLLLILLLPVGADLAFSQEILTIKLKAGPLRWKLFPSEAKKPSESAPEAQDKEKKKNDKAKSGFQLKIGKDDLSVLLKILFRALRRFGRCLSVDLLRLHWTAAADDPYDAVLQFGALNAGFGAMLPLAETVLKIREREISTDVDFEAHKPRIDARVIATLQVWEIIFIAVCAGAAAAAWYLRKRKQARTAAKTAAKKGTESWINQT